MTRPDDVLFRTRIETFALIRTLLPIGLLAGALVGPVFVTDPRIGMWLSALCLLLVLVGLHLVSRLPLYPAHAFGIEHRYEEDPFETGRRQCVRCDALAESGTHRRYARQLVFLGIPFHTLEWGSNDFCADCVAFEAEDEDDAGSSADPERTTEPEPTPTETPGRETGQPQAQRTGRAQTQRRKSSTATTNADTETGRLERARRVDRSDETTALELRRAFE